MRETEEKYPSIFKTNFLLWRSGRIDFQCFETENSAAQLTIIRKKEGKKSPKRKN